jgi:hypothetical protein
MRLPKGIGTVVAGGLVALALAGCGGGEDGNEPSADAQASVKAFSESFSADTGLNLEAEQLPGGAKLLVLDRNGDASEVTQDEAEYLSRFGNAQIYLVDEGDPDVIFEAATGQTGKSRPATTGGDTVSINSEVADEPDEDGVIWTRNCVEYEKKTELNTCTWTGTKRYGRNVIVTWTQTSEGLSEGARELDAAVSAAVAAGA